MLRELIPHSDPLLEREIVKAGREDRKEAPRKVLMTVDAVGGIWRYAIDLTRALAANGTTTLLVGMGPPPSADQAAEALAVSGLDLAWLDLPLDWTAADQGALSAVPPSLARLVDKNAVDLVHLNAPSQAAGLRFDCPIVVAAHSCLKTWWRAVKGGSLPDDWLWRADLNSAGFAAAAVILVPSAAFANELTCAYGPLPGLRVVHNASTLEVRRRPKRPIVLAVGRWWDEAKNFETLDQAAGASPWPIEAAGPLVGPNDARAPKPLALTALGALSPREVADRLGEAEIFVSPALYEPFGLGVLEAALSGTALVLSDIPTFRELWDQAALFVDPRDPRAVADAINRIARDAAARAALGKAAHARAKRYGSDAQVKGVLAAYREAARLAAQTR